MNYKLLIIIFLGLAIRLLLLPNPGFEADIAFWKSWSLAAADNGIVWMTQNTNNNYPPGFGYILWLMGKAYYLIGNPHDFNQFWQKGNLGFLFIAKLIPILSDIAITVGIYWLLWQPKLLGFPQLANKKNLLNFNFNIGRWQTKISLPLIVAAAYFLHPVPILDGAWWGQVDAFGVLFLLVTLILLFKNKPGLAFFTIVFGALLKLQNIIYLPILSLYVLRRNGLDGIKRSLLGAFLAWIAGTLPFLLTKTMEKALYLMSANADWFPWLSLHAYNIWWIVSGGDGMGFSDKFLLWGALSPKTIGLILFSSAYLVATLAVFLKPQPKVLLVSLFLVVFSFFMLLTQSHERYIFPAFMILPLLFPFAAQKNLKLNYWFIALLVYWFILSLTATFDLHRTLIVNYPHNGLPFLSAFKSTNLTIWASFINVLLYLIALIYTTYLAGIWLLPLAILVTFSGLIFANRDYLFSGKISLTKLKMTGWYQEYRGPIINMTVDSAGGPKTWKRLSSNYFFYEKGIGTHAKSELVYELRGKFSKFSTDYGIDTEANTAASVQFQIVGDDKILFTSETMGRFDLPRHVEVDISGVNVLKLITLPTEDGNRDDHADWLNPVLYK